MQEDVLLTDDDVCARLGITKRTLRSHLRDGPPRRRNPDTVDLRRIEHITIGGKRRWSKAALDKVMPKLEEED